MIVINFDGLIVQQDPFAAFEIIDIEPTLERNLPGIRFATEIDVKMTFTPGVLENSWVYESDYFSLYKSRTLADVLENFNPFTNAWERMRGTRVPGVYSIVQNNDFSPSGEEINRRFLKRMCQGYTSVAPTYDPFNRGGVRVPPVSTVGTIYGSENLFGAWIVDAVYDDGTVKLKQYRSYTQERPYATISATIIRPQYTKWQTPYRYARIGDDDVYTFYQSRTVLDVEVESHGLPEYSQKFSGTLFNVQREDVPYVGMILHDRFPLTYEQSGRVAYRLHIGDHDGEWYDDQLW